MFLPLLSRKKCPFCLREVSFVRDRASVHQCRCSERAQIVSLVLENLKLCLFTFLLLCFLGTTTFLMYARSSYTFNEPTSVAAEYYANEYDSKNPSPIIRQSRLVTLND